MKLSAGFSVRQTRALIDAHAPEGDVFVRAAAFVALLDHFPYAEVKARLRVIESTRQINDVIKTRLDRSSKAAA
jgi:hypothetical protein